MLRLDSPGRRFSVSILTLLITLVFAWLIFKPFFVQMGLSEPLSLKELSRAISYDNNNPSHHYRRALYRYYDPAGRDLSLAMDSYARAISLNPANAMYWIGLAKVLESTGELDASSSALERAIKLNPTYEKSRWMKVNLLLSRASTIEALNQLRLIIDEHPPERRRAFNVLKMITRNDVELILEEGIPHKQEPMESYLSFLMWEKNTEGVMIVWKALSDGFEISSYFAAKYINYLVSVGEIWKARRYSDAYEGRVFFTGAQELISNNGFEDDICDNRLCWWIDPVQGASVRIDGGVSFKGGRSLKIEFDGSENVDFRHLFKVLPLEPNTPYLLKASVKSEGITTTNGLFMEFYGIGGCKFYSTSKAVTGSGDWTELRIDVNTPPGCRAGTVRFRRLKSDKIDNLIGGTLWIDDVRLSRAGAR